MVWVAVLLSSLGAAHAEPERPLESGELIPVGTPDRRGPRATDAIISDAVGAAYVVGSAYPDLFVRTGKFGMRTGLFLYPWSDTADTGGRRRSHRDTVNEECTDLVDQHREEVLLADRNATCRNDDVGAGFDERVSDHAAVVGKPLDPLNVATISLDETGQHHGVAVHDVRSVGSGAGWEQFVAADDDPHPGAAVDRDRGDSDARQQPGILGPDPPSSR